MNKCKNITVEQYLELCKEHDVQLIDIRTKCEHAREKINGSQNLPLEALLEKKFSKEDKVVFCCQSGNRTRQAEDEFLNLGIDDVYILDGGLNAWKKSSQKTTINKKAPLPLMRQVQIIVGFAVVIGIILGFTVSPYFNLISLFFGSGLLFVGISGFCGLANVLMLFPYNKTKK